uniref:Putative secreted protein n=1 Tax=Anopheles marajoara TaxID=58244 RepID=A0A2M4CFQ2_9DIPT
MLFLSLSTLWHVLFCTNARALHEPGFSSHRKLHNLPQPPLLPQGTHPQNHGFASLRLPPLSFCLAPK